MTMDKPLQRMHQVSVKINQLVLELGESNYFVTSVSSTALQELGNNWVLMVRPASSLAAWLTQKYGSPIHQWNTVTTDGDLQGFFYWQAEEEILICTTKKFKCPSSEHWVELNEEQ